MTNAANNREPEHPRSTGSALVHRSCTRRASTGVANRVHHKHAVIKFVRDVFQHNSSSVSEQNLEGKMNFSAVHKADKNMHWQERYEKACCTSIRQARITHHWHVCITSPGDSLLRYAMTVAVTGLAQQCSLLCTFGPQVDWDHGGFREETRHHALLQARKGCRPCVSSQVPCGRLTPTTVTRCHVPLVGLNWSHTLKSAEL